MIVNDFLVKFFVEIVDYTFTASVEKQFDEIANGKQNWHNMIDQFYHGFHETVEKTQNVDRSEVQKSREIGKHPETGQLVQVRLGRFGPYVQIGEAEEGGKNLNASLNKSQRMDTITMEEALELFKMPRPTGEFEGKPMVVGIGKFGPYVKHDNSFVSLPKDVDPYTITETECVELIENKRVADANKLIKTFDENPDVKILNGRFGPYVVIGKQNVKIPKGKEPAELTLDECIALGAEQADKPAKPKGKWGKKK
jgi:DNA topoisomerase-1